MADTDAANSFPAKLFRCLVADRVSLDAAPLKAMHRVLLIHKTDTDPFFSLPKFAASSGLTEYAALSTLLLIELMRGTGVEEWPPPRHARPFVSLLERSRGAKRPHILVRDVSKLHAWYFRTVVFAAPGLAYLASIEVCGGLRGIEASVRAAVAGRVGASVSPGASASPPSPHSPPCVPFSELVLLGFAFEAISQAFISRSGGTLQEVAEGGGVAASRVAMLLSSALRDEFFCFCARHAVPVRALAPALFESSNAVAKALVGVVGGHMLAMLTVSTSSGDDGGEEGIGGLGGSVELGAAATPPKPMTFLDRKKTVLRINHSRLQVMARAYRCASPADAATLAAWAEGKEEGTTEAAASNFVGFLAARVEQRVLRARRLRARDAFDVCATPSEALALDRSATRTHRDRERAMAIWRKAFASKKKPTVVAIYERYTSSSGMFALCDATLQLPDGRRFELVGVSPELWR